jgi:Domain of unknown function (DUF6916)
MAEVLTLEHFTPHVEKEFRAPEWPHPLKLRRIDTRQLEEWEREMVRRQPFILIFSGPPREVIREGFYTVSVADGPSFGLYIIPIQTLQRDRQDYQAVFN